MSIDVNWKINSLNRMKEDGYVFEVFYGCVWEKAIPDENDPTNNCYGQYNHMQLEKPETLIPYTDLTQDTVIGWVKDKLGEEEVQRIEAEVKQAVSEILEPTKESGTPW